MVFLLIWCCVDGVVLVIVGGGLYLEMLCKLVYDCGVVDYVMFIGGVVIDEFFVYYVLVDVFVMLCCICGVGMDVEGLGIVFFEVFVVGVLVIVGNFGGVLEMVQYNKIGLVVDGRLVDWVVDVVVELLIDWDWVVVMGVVG